MRSLKDSIITLRNKLRGRRKSKRWYVEYQLLGRWPGLFAGIEIEPSNSASIFSIRISVTVIYCVLFDTEIVYYKNST